MEKKIGTKLALAGEPKGKHLVGGWPTPLRNISQLGWWQPQYVEKKLFQTTTQKSTFLINKDQNPSYLDGLEGMVNPNSNWSSFFWLLNVE
jgi:hypothetical protein